MEKNTDLYFPKDFDNKYLEFIKSKNTLSSNNINLFYEVLYDMLIDDGKNFKTWIGDTNFRKYIFEINSERATYRKKLSEYIKSNNIPEEQSITLKILKVQVEDKIEKLYKDYQILIGKIENKLDSKKISSITTLKDFFNDKVSDSKMKEIQITFKDLDIGKEMAILIHLLVKKELIKKFDNSNRNSKTGKSRIFFVRNFTNNKDLNHIKGINNFLDSEENLRTIMPIKTGLYLDETYNNIDKQLNKIVSNC